MLTLADLGVLRDVVGRRRTARVVVAITPTYSGCPAMATMRDDLVHRLKTPASRRRGTGRARPAWSSDWITERGRRPSRAGISPPGPARRAGPVPISLSPTRRASSCPRCGRRRRRLTSEFGATACKALYRCTPLPRTVRARQGDLSDRRARSAQRAPSTPLTVPRSSSCATTPWRSPSTCPTSCAEAYAFAAGSVAHPAPRHRRAGAPPRLLDLRAGRRARRASASARSPAGCSPRGWSTRSAGRRDRGADPDRQLPRRPGARVAGTCASPPARASRRCCRSPSTVLAHPEARVTLLYGNRTTRR